MGGCFRIGVVLAAVALGVVPGAASAYNAQVEENGGGLKTLHVFTSETQATADSFEIADAGGNRVRILGSDAAVAGVGCTASGRAATCDVESGLFVDTFGGADRVVIDSAPQAVVIFGGAGNDDLRVLQATFSQRFGVASGILGDDGDDLLIGSQAQDFIDGRGDDDVVVGKGGDDQLNGALGGDVLSGGTGVDQATFLEGTDTARSVGITVHVGDGVCNDGSEEDDAVGTRPPLPAGVSSTCGRGNAVERDDVQGDIESILGTHGDDSIIGNSSNGTIAGLAGDDLLEGGLGADTVTGEGTFPGAFFGPPADGDDTILLRDGVTDFSSSCGGSSGDRAVADPDDPVNTDCETVERGAAGVTGPNSDGFAPPIVVGPGPNPTNPQPAQPVTPPPPPPPGSPPTGNETGGTGPGGGDDGATPPDLRIFGNTLIVDRKRRAQVRITCVYRAQECEGSAELTATKDIGKGKKGIDRGDLVGRKQISIPWGRTGKVPVKVSKGFVAALGDDSTKLKLAVEARDSGAGKGAAVVRASRKLTTELEG